MSDPKKVGHLILWIVTAVIAAGMFCLGYFTHVLGGWAVTNACTISGVFILLSGGLYLVTWFGAFDIFNYGFRDVFFHMNPNKNAVKKYKDYPEYLEKKREERKANKPYFWPFLAIGGALLIAGIVLSMCWTGVARSAMSSSSLLS